MARNPDRVALVRGATVFEPADPPRAGQIAFHPAPGLDGPVVRMPVAEAMPLLSLARREPGAHPSAAFWGSAVVVALQLVARGRILPAAGESWRAGPLTGLDVERVEELAAGLADPDADGLVRAFLDAVADGMPRTAAAMHAARPGAGPAITGNGSGLGEGIGAPIAPAARSLTVRAVIGTGDPPGDPRTLFSGGGLLRFDWQLALGGDPLTEAEMDLLAESHRPLVRLRDQWVLLDAAATARLRNRTLKSLTPIAALALALAGTADIDGEQVEIAATPWLETLRRRLTEPQAAEPIGAPPGLTATLRDYQLRGLRWLAALTALGLGGCLADDMGLGKTVTLIALHLHRGGGPTLVVCPASLLGNWEREIRRFAPGAAVRRHHGPARTLAGVSGGFVLTTYGTMRLDAAELAGTGWDLVVADEAQHVKNPRSGTARALRTIPAAARVALTGTPVENTLTDLWAILDWTTPGLLGTVGGFRARWVRPIESDKDPVVADRLAALVRPFLLRRRKSDPGIVPELPPKTETDQPAPLTREQAALYAAVVRETLAKIAEADGMARRGLVVKLLTGLKQICNHPAQYLKEPHGRLTGRSGKLELLDELLDTIVAEDGAALVFTQYVTMARLLERHLAARGLPTQLLHGGTPVARREELVRRFQDGEVPVFLLSLKAAGTGLNLTRADHVVHFDRWWNPAVEEQATDRAHRIGQTRPVQVHRLIAEGTVEDRIADLLAGKRALAEAVLSAGEAALSELPLDELTRLVELR
ncbi:helicase SNF2 [Acrocarpospora corrugata]|uniref:Helicase SNF2 n=1 Tax=Acrocarpospora corrugata TaxID=35763 RepID=A0A5M3VTZ5_9ACTN|nr:DEAD/DEAH box helicase [Acrocarpospora corrugata]GES00277.1 helicase SNF2 [Acrocarpospora corrugata]